MKKLHQETGCHAEKSSVYAPGFAKPAFTDRALVCTTCSSTSSTDDCVFLGTVLDSTETIQLPNKNPPYSAHGSARRVQSIVGSRLPCGGQAPFRPIWLCGTGFHRLCLYLYLHPFPGVMHRFSVDVCCLRRYAKGAYRTSLHGRTKSPASALSNLSYIKYTPLQAALSTVFL